MSESAYQGLTTTILEPGDRTLSAAVLPSATEPVLNVGDILYVGSGTRRLRVTGVEYILNVEKSDQGPLGLLAGRQILTELAPPL